MAVSTWYSDASSSHSSTDEVGDDEDGDEEEGVELKILPFVVVMDWKEISLEEKNEVDDECGDLQTLWFWNSRTLWALL